MINNGNTSLIDYVTRKTGTPFSIVEIAVENETSLSDILTPGQILKETLFQEVEPDNFNEIIFAFIKEKQIVNTISGQTLFDLAIQETGDVFKVFDFAVANNLSLNESFIPGQKINVPEVEKAIDKVNHFKGMGIKIATYIEQKTSFELPGDFPFSF